MKRDTAVVQDFTILDVNPKGLRNLRNDLTMTMGPNISHVSMPKDIFIRIIELSLEALEKRIVLQ